MVEWDAGKRKRLETVFAGGRPDGPPVFGGWIASPRTLLAITGAAEAEYKTDPMKVAIDAYRKLGMDGLIAIFLSNDLDNYRCVDKDSYIKSDSGLSFEDAVRKVEEMPSAEEYERDFDFDAEYAAFRNELATMQEKCGDMLYMPAQWGAGAMASWYGEYGYENYFLIVGMRPDLGRKLMQMGGAIGRRKSLLIARAVGEGLYPKAVLLGEDICTQRGPMISTRFLKEHYAPALAYGLEPLLKVGCRPVWHSDGDVRELIPMLIDCGIQGFQGFQPECGMKIEEIIKLRTARGEKMLIFGPFAVTTELPVLNPDDIRKRVRYYAGLCRDEADFVFFTSNTINPDVPLENLTAMYDEIMKLR